MERGAVRFGHLTLQPGRELLADGHPIALGRKPLDILTRLVTAEGALVTKDELIDAVWPGLVIEENAIQAHITRLRRVLGREAERLKTVRGLGYRFELPGDAPAALAPVLAPTPAAAPRRHALAVLPLANPDADSALDYLVFGIPNDLIESLWRQPLLSVPDRMASFAYHDKGLDDREVARALGADHVLGGSLRRRGNRMLLRVHLFEAARGRRIWEHDFDCAQSDLLSVQDELVQAVAAMLTGREAAPRPRTTDPEVFDLCLRGRALTDRASPDNLMRAVALLEEAVARDPYYPDARSALARALGWACASGVIRIGRFVESLQQAERACELDPQDAGSHAVAGCNNARVGNWVRGAALLRRAVALHDVDADLRCIYGGGFLLDCGHVEAAVQQTARAVELAPASPVTHFSHATTLFAQGRLDEADARMAMAIDLGMPAALDYVTVVLAGIALARGDHESAARHSVGPWLAILGPQSAPLAAGIFAAAAGAAPRAPAIAAYRAFLDGLGRDLTVGAYLRLGGRLLDWALLLEDRECVRKVAGLILSSWRETGVLEITAFVALWSERGRPFIADECLAGLFAKSGLAEYWRIHGPPSCLQSPP